MLRQGARREVVVEGAPRPVGQQPCTWHRAPHALDDLLEQQGLEVGVPVKAEDPPPADEKKDAPPPDITPLEVLKNRAKELGVPNYATMKAETLTTRIAEKEAAIADKPESHYSMGLLLNQMKQSDKAKEHLIKAVDETREEP